MELIQNLPAKRRTETPRRRVPVDGRRATPLYRLRITCLIWLLRLHKVNAATNETAPVSATT
jgi:hypothetical protein